MLTRSSIPTRARSHLTRVASVLGIVVVIAVPLNVLSNEIVVSVDGQQIDLRTYADTVEEALDRLAIDVGRNDQVTPAMDEPVEHGMNIEVVRAAVIDVHVDGSFLRRVVAPVDSVAAALTEAGFDDIREREAEVVPSWTAPVADGDAIHIWMPREVSLTVDGQQRQLRTMVTDVAGLLVEQGVHLRPDDRMSVDEDEPLALIDEVIVERVEYVDEVEEVVLEHEEQRHETSELERDTIEVEHEGEDGLRLDTYRVQLVDGHEAQRRLMSREVVAEPQPRVVKVGTAPPSRVAGAPAADDPVWDRLAECEANGNWQNISSNGMYYGGLQFLPSTWRWVGGSGMPHHASRAEQIYRAQILKTRLGWGQWPECSRLIGLR